MEFLNKIGDAFKTFSVVDGLEIALLAVIIYYLFSFLRYNNTSKLVYFYIILFALTLIFTVFEFHALGLIFKSVVVLSWIFVIVIYSVNIKRIFWNIERKSMLDKISRNYQCTDEELIESTDSIIKALQNMAKKDIGALIVLTPNELPSAIIQSGTLIDAIVSSELLESIFNHKTPLHDGAVFIKANKIVAAGCFLPLSQEQNLSKEFGTRHRAAIGISESAEYVALVVSEETGIISIAQKGEIKRYVDSQMLADKIHEVYGIKNPKQQKSKQWSWWKR